MDPSLQLPTSSQSRALDAALWQFMLAVYARTGVTAACLDIQERCSTDIVLLLTWLYHEHAGRQPLGATEIRALASLVDEWRTRTVLPLRHLRVELRTAGVGMPDEAREALRGKIKALELAAERMQVSMMAEWLADHPVRDAVAPGSALSMVINRPETVSQPLALLHREAALT
ncbi:MAG: hypothetical protein JWL86_6405 [Rhizobium sp.]|nr:hypothetical protein [Rhizobium sp.]